MLLNSVFDLVEMQTKARFVGFGVPPRSYKGVLSFMTGFHIHAFLAMQNKRV